MALTHVQLRDAIAQVSKTTDGRPEGHVIDLPAGIFDIRDTLVLGAHGLGFRGKGPDRTILRNVNTNQADMFRIANIGGPTLQHLRMENLALESEEGAGHIFSYDFEAGLGRARFYGLAVHQQNPAKSIMRASFLKTDADSKGGFFFNVFRDGIWEHGKTNSAPTVPAFDLDINFSGFNGNQWKDMRCDLHHGSAPFWRVLGNADSTELFGNRWSDITIEYARGGAWYLTGCHRATIRDVELWDSDIVDGHLINLELSNVKGCDRTVLRDITGLADSPRIGVAGTGRSAPYTSSGQAVTVNPLTAHGYAVGQQIYTTGDFTGHWVITAKTANTLTFTKTGSAPPASGTLTVYESALHVRLGAAASRTILDNIGGPSATDVAIDLNNNAVEIRGATSLATLLRVSPTLSTLTGIGSGVECRVETDVVKCNAIEEREAGGGVELLGTSLKVLAYATVAVDLPSIAAGAGYWHVATVAGAIAGDVVVVLPPSSGPGGPANGLIPGQAWASNTDEITIPFFNASAGAVDATSRSYRVVILGF